MKIKFYLPIILGIFIIPDLIHAYTVEELFHDKQVLSEVCKIYNDSKSNDNDLNFLENVKNHFYKETTDTLASKTEGWQEKSFILFQVTSLLNILYMEQFDKDVAEKENYANQYAEIEKLAWNNIKRDLVTLFKKLSQAGVISGSLEDFQMSLENFMIKNANICGN